MPTEKKLQLIIGLRGKLLLATFLPAQIPLVAYLVAHRLRAAPEAQIAVLMLAAAIGIIVAASIISQVVGPLRRGRKRLRALLGAYQLVPAELQKEGDDEEMLASLDQSILELKEAGLIDPLTGVGNRRACEQRLRQDISRASRTATPYTIAFFDLDQLKDINDREGHLAGDRCLTHLADGIRWHVRDGDWVARWGGDEFVLALWNAGNEGAEAICDRILTGLRNTQRLSEVTASVGIAQLEPGQSPMDLLDNADEALRRSKSEGRNRLSVFELR
jgi:diguanylate cyclase (GGDEF)-like protein